jgi:hypothetical protein
MLIAAISVDANQSTVNSTVLRSTDGGLTWATATTGITGNFQANPLAASATNPNKVYLTNINPYQNGLVYVSNDSGQSWTATILADSTMGIYDLVLDPSNDQVLYVSGAGFSNNKVMRSVNGGVTFASFEQGLDNAPGLLYGQPSLAYAGGPAPKLVTASRAGVFATALYTTRMATQTVNLVDGQTLDGVDFGQRVLWGEVSGTVWEDANGIHGVERVDGRQGSAGPDGDPCGGIGV